MTTHMEAALQFTPPSSDAPPTTLMQSPLPSSNLVTNTNDEMYNNDTTQSNAYLITEVPIEGSSASLLDATQLPSIPTHSALPLSSPASSLPLSGHLTPTSPSTHTTSPTPSDRAASTAPAFPLYQHTMLEPSTHLNTPLVTTDQHEASCIDDDIEYTKDVQQHTVNPVARKINRILNANFNDGELINAFQHISKTNKEFSTGQNMQQLRQKLMLDKTHSSDTLLKVAAPIKTHLERLKNIINAVEQTTNMAFQELQVCRAPAAKVFKAIEELQHKRSIAACKQVACNEFLESFKLEKCHMDALTNRDRPLEGVFLHALEASEGLKSRAECFMTENPLSVSFVEDILTKTSALQEIAVERLFEYMQTRIKAFITSDEEMPSFGDLCMNEMKFENTGGPTKEQSSDERLPTGGAPQQTAVTPTLTTEQQAFKILHAFNPRYCLHCIQETARGRRFKLVQRFHTALHKGDPTINLNPIEMHAYDPLRFISDMVAWIHENAVTEKEIFSSVVLPSLISLKKQKTREEGSLDGSDNGGVSMNEIEEEVTWETPLDIVFGGLCTPFRIRVEHVLQSKPNVVVVYKIIQLLLLLAKVLHPIMSPETNSVSPEDDEETTTTIGDTVEADVHQTRQEGTSVFQINSTNGRLPVFTKCIMALHDEAQMLFQQLLEERSTEVFSLPTSSCYTPDLSPPQFVRQTGYVLSEILEVYDTACLPEQRNEDEIATILDAMMNPVVNFTRRIAHSLTTGEAAVYLINCYLSLEKILAPYPYTARRVEVLVNLVDDQMIQLIAYETDAILHKLGFKRILEEVETSNTSSSIHPFSISNCFNSFYSILCVGTLLSLPLIEKLRGRHVRSEARLAVTKNVADAYERIYEMSQINGIEAHEPSRIRTLLDVL